MGVAAISVTILWRSTPWPIPTAVPLPLDSSARFELPASEWQFVFARHPLIAVSCGLNCCGGAEARSSSDHPLESSCSPSDPFQKVQNNREADRVISLFCQSRAFSMLRFVRSGSVGLLDCKGSPSRAAWQSCLPSCSLLTFEAFV